MPALAPILVALLGMVLVVLVARRERSAVFARRGRMLDACRPLFEESRLTIGSDGFPRLDGRIDGCRVVLDLIPDSMTIRRLPQLWLSATILRPLPLAAPFGVLTRPSGTEFYSLTQGFAHRLDPPPGLPPEILARGASVHARNGLTAARSPLAGLLADPRVKEVVATKKGLRVVFRAAEGERGPHLLLRQCAFAEAGVAAADLLALFDGLVCVGEAIGGRDAARVASGSRAAP